MHNQLAHALEILSPTEYLRPALDVPYCHHEKWGGSGSHFDSQMVELFCGEVK